MFHEPIPLYHGRARLVAPTAFLYSRPAINAMSIVVTAKALGIELRIARAPSPMAFAVFIGARVPNSATPIGTLMFCC